MVVCMTSNSAHPFLKIKVILKNVLKTQCNVTSLYYSHLIFYTSSCLDHHTVQKFFPLVMSNQSMLLMVIGSHTTAIIEAWSFNLWAIKYPLLMTMHHVTSSLMQLQSAAVLGDKSLASKTDKVIDSSQLSTCCMDKIIPQLCSTCWCIIVLLLWLAKLEMDRYM